MEGFCLPALEAKAFGVPVVSRPVEAVKELLDSSDIICDDLSCAALASGLIQGIERYDSVDHARDADLGRFSIERTTQALVSLYREAAQNFCARMQ